MTTPELRFDEAGFLDLSVFDDVEPDVVGHGPGPLDPALEVDRRALDDTFDAGWVDAALRHAASTDDALLLALVPTTTPVDTTDADSAPVSPAPTPAAGDDDIDAEGLRNLVLGLRPDSDGAAS